MHCLDKTYRVCEITNTKHYCGLYDDRFTIIETDSDDFTPDRRPARQLSQRKDYRVDKWMT